MAESAASSGGGGGGGSGGVATNPFDFGVSFHADTARLLSDIKSAETMVTEAIKRMNLAAVVKVRMEVDKSGLKLDLPPGMTAGIQGGATKQVPPMGGNVFVEPKPPVERGTPTAPPQAAAMPPAKPGSGNHTFTSSGGKAIDPKKDPVLAAIFSKLAEAELAKEQAGAATPIPASQPTPAAQSAPPRELQPTTAAPVPNGWTDKRTWGFGAADGGAPPATTAAPVPPSNAAISNQRLLDMLGPGTMSAEGAELEAKILAANRAARAARAAARAPAAPAAVGDYPHPIGPPRPPGYTVPVGSTGGYPTPIGPTQRTKNQIAKSLYTPEEAIAAANGESGKDLGFFNNSRTNASALAKMARATIRAGGMMFAMGGVAGGMEAAAHSIEAASEHMAGNFVKSQQAMEKAADAIRSIPAVGQAFGMGLDAGKAVVSASASLQDLFPKLTDAYLAFDKYNPTSRLLGMAAGDSSQGLFASMLQVSKQDREVRRNKERTGEDSPMLPLLRERMAETADQRMVLGTRGTVRLAAESAARENAIKRQYAKEFDAERTRLREVGINGIPLDNLVFPQISRNQKADLNLNDANRAQGFRDVGESTKADTQTTAITRLRMNGKFHDAILQQNENAFQKELAQYTTNENMTNAEVDVVYAKRRALAEKFTAADLELKKQWKNEEAVTMAALDSAIGVASLQRLKQFDDAATRQLKDSLDAEIQARKTAGGENVAAEVQKLEELRRLRIDEMAEQQKFTKWMRSTELNEDIDVLELRLEGRGGDARFQEEENRFQTAMAQAQTDGASQDDIKKMTTKRARGIEIQTMLERLNNDDLTGGNRLLGMQLQGRSERELIEERNALKLKIDIREAKDRFTDPAQRQRRIDLLTKDSQMRTELEQRGLSQVGTYSEADVGQTLDRLRSFRNWQKPDMSGLLGGVGGAGGGDGTSGGDKEEEVKDKTSHGLLGEIRDAVKGGMIAVAA